MRTAKPTDTALLKSLQNRRQDILRELDRLNRAILETQQQLACLDPRDAVLTKPERAAA